jgi:hypothetical protein
VELVEKPRHVSWPTTDVADLTARPRLLGKAGEKFAIEGLMLQLVKQMNRVLLGQSVVIRTNRPDQAICHAETQSRHFWAGHIS